MVSGKVRKVKRGIVLSSCRIIIKVQSYKPDSWKSATIENNKLMLKMINILKYNVDQQMTRPITIIHRLNI